MPNFSSLAGLEVAEKFVVVGRENMATMSNSNEVALELLRVELGYVGF